MAKVKKDVNTGEDLVTVALSDPHGRVTDPVVEVPKSKTEPLVKDEQYEEVSDVEKVRRAAEKLQAEKAHIPAQDKRTERIRKGENDSGYPDDYAERIAKAAKELQKNEDPNRTFEVPDDYQDRLADASRELQKAAAEQDEMDETERETAEKATSRAAESTEKAVKPEPKAR